MINLKIGVLAFVAVFVSGCDSFPQLGALSHCGHGDNRPWAYLSTPPSDATELRILAGDTVQNKYLIAHFPVELWFSLENGELMLCRSERAPFESDAGVWWQFKRTSEGYEVSKSLGWVTLD